jgi:hypothetical protein
MGDSSSAFRLRMEEPNGNVRYLVRRRGRISLINPNLFHLPMEGLPFLPGKNAAELQFALEDAESAQEAIAAISQACHPIIVEEVGGKPRQR